MKHEFQRRVDIVAVLPWLKLAAVDVEVALPSAQSYAARAAKEAGSTAAMPEWTKDVLDYVTFWFVPFPVDTCGYMGKEAVQFGTGFGTSQLRLGALPRMHLCAGE